MTQAQPAGRDKRGFLARLRRDTAGNTMAIMAAALVPLCAFAGSAMDMARLYVVRVRLQQACDAGVLAGRKFLPSGSTPGNALTGASLTQANTYFTNNITTSWLGSGWFSGTPSFTSVTVADSKGNTQVAGTASANVPMTLMQMFGISAQTLNVQCQAAFSTPDTDVMFVLDTTGSMGCAVTRNDADCSTYAGTTSNQLSSSNPDGSTSYYVKEEMSGATNISRIDALRQAVNAFYNTVATTKDASTNVRYGFVPYTSTVNVGSLLYNLNSSYLVSKWPYQSRVVVGDNIVSTTSSKTVTAADQNACNAYYSRSPANRTNAAGDPNPGYPNNGTATADIPAWTPASTSGTTTTPASCTINTDVVSPKWSYQAGVQYDLTNYLKGNSMVDPARVDGSKTVWNGCIEERDTTAGATSFDINNLPPDLDPDLVPSSDSTRWRPMWPDIVYARQLYNYSGSPGPVNYAGDLLNYNDPGLAQQGAMSCPAQAKPLFLPLDTASGASTISNYVSGLKALGGTYHDVGMIWGTRMLSPTGLWANNNKWAAGRAAPKRIIVFVTDGTMSPGSQVYGAYATESVDRRVTGSAFSGSDPGSTANNAAYTEFHNQRFLAECAKAKSNPLNFDVWVVEVAQASSTQLSACASRPSQVLVGQTTQQLTAAFKVIAQQIAMLRVSQ